MKIAEAASLKITNAATKPTLWLYGVIGAQLGGITAEDMRYALASVPETQDLELRIHSEGGVYTEAIAMQANLARRSGKVDVVVDGLAASAASIIAMGGDSITMASGSYMMIHESRGGVDGATAKELRKYADQLEAINSEIVKIYMTRWKGSEEELRTALDAESWYLPADAMRLGLADVEDNSFAVAACADFSKFNYAKVPALLQQATPGQQNKSALMARVEERLAELFPIEQLQEA